MAERFDAVELDLRDLWLDGGSAEGRTAWQM
jgi:hypothetical protein